MVARLEEASGSAAQAGREAGLRRMAPIVPKNSVAGRTLIAVVAIMTFLAALTVGAVDRVREAAGSWETEVAREVTIQIRPSEGRDLDAAVAHAVTLAQATPGASGVHPYTDQETARLLEPWLGAGLDLGELPVPRLIVLQVDEDHPGAIADLKARLDREVPGASLDDHRQWIGRLREMTRGVVAIGLAILGLVISATVLSVVFATRGTMAGNREIVEVLNLVGATDAFIAREFQRRFLRLGLLGGLIGGGAALLLFFLASWVSARETGMAIVDQADVLFGRFELSPTSYLGVGIAVVVIAGATAVTSRLTVMRFLREHE